MKTLTALLLSTSIAFAGNFIYEAPAEPQVVRVLPPSHDHDHNPPVCKRDCEPVPDCITKACVVKEHYGLTDGQTWKNLPKADRKDVRKYWEKTGRHKGIKDWSGFREWVML